MGEEDIGDRDPVKAACCLCSELEPSVRAPDVISRGLEPVLGECSLKHGASIVAADNAVVDKDVLCDIKPAGTEGCLEADSVIKRSIDPAVAYRDIARSIDIHAIAVCIDDHVLEEDVAASCRDDGEVPGLPHVESAENDVLGIEESDALGSVVPDRLLIEEEMPALVIKAIDIIRVVPVADISWLCPELRIGRVTP